MSVNENDKPKEVSQPPANAVNMAKNPVVQLAQAINTLSARLGKMELNVIKINADIEIAEKDRKLLSDRLDFAFDKIDSLESK